jgi:transposase
MAKRKTRRERRTFNDDYKQQVLELVRSGEKSVSQICRDLDLTESLVRNWIKSDQASNGIMTQNSLSETDQQELERLRTENKRLKTEREILKKAAAFFAKESL